MCGGGGPSGDTKYNWNDDLAPRWQELLDSGRKQAYENTYQPYPHDRITGMSPDQLQSIHNIETMTGRGGEAAAVKANNQAQKTVEGDYLTGPDANPYAGMDSPAFKNTLYQGMADITNAYDRGTSADTTRMFNLSGAFGGSAHQNAIANNEAALGKTLMQYESGMQNDQYNRSGGYFEGERGRMMGAIPYGQNTNDMFLRANNALMGAGDAQRSLGQDQLNMNYQDWLDAQNRNFQNADWLSGLYSRAQGGMSPNSSYQQSGYQASPFSQLVGAGLLYKGMT